MRTTLSSYDWVRGKARGHRLLRAAILAKRSASIIPGSVRFFANAAPCEC